MRKAIFFLTVVGMWILAEARVWASVSEVTSLDTGDFLVGAYYMPPAQTSRHRIWASVNKWNLNNGAYDWPYLGMYDPTKPEVMEWQTKWALEHGVSLFIFDWYFPPYSKKPIWEQSVNSFINSNNAKAMKFSLYFTSVKLPKAVPNQLDLPASEEFIRQVARYWAEHYFNQPNYLKVGGWPVVFTDAPDMSDWKAFGMSRAIGLLKETLEGYGYEGLYMVEENGAYVDGDYSGYRQVLDRSRADGFDAVTSYGYDYRPGLPDCSTYGTYLGKFTSEVLGWAAGSQTKFIPSLRAFYDDRIRINPPTKVCPYDYKTDALVAPFESALVEWKKAYTRTDGGVIVEGKKLVTISAWNEWVEGQSIEPGKRLGGGSDPFSFLKKVGKIFGGSELESERPAQSQGPNAPGPYDLGRDSTDVFNFDNQMAADGFITNTTNSALVMEGSGAVSYGSDIGGAAG